MQSIFSWSTKKKFKKSVQWFFFFSSANKQLNKKIMEGKKKNTKKQTTKRQTPFVSWQQDSETLPDSIRNTSAFQKLLKPNTKIKLSSKA